MKGSSHRPFTSGRDARWADASSKARDVSASHEINKRSVSQTSTNAQGFEEIEKQFGFFSLSKADPELASSLQRIDAASELPAHMQAGMIPLKKQDMTELLRRQAQAARDQARREGNRDVTWESDFQGLQGGAGAGSIAIPASNIAITSTPDFALPPRSLPGSNVQAQTTAPIDADGHLNYEDFPSQNEHYYEDSEPDSEIDEIIGLRPRPSNQDALVQQETVFTGNINSPLSTPGSRGSSDTYAVPFVLLAEAFAQLNAEKSAQSVKSSKNVLSRELGIWRAKKVERKQQNSLSSPTKGPKKLSIINIYADDDSGDEVPLEVAQQRLALDVLRPISRQRPPQEALHLVSSSVGTPARKSPSPNNDRDSIDCYPLNSYNEVRSVQRREFSAEWRGKKCDDSEKIVSTIVRNDGNASTYDDNSDEAFDSTAGEAMCFGRKGEIDVQDRYREGTFGDHLEEDEDGDSSEVANKCPTYVARDRVPSAGKRTVKTWDEEDLDAFRENMVSNTEDEGDGSESSDFEVNRPSSHRPILNSNPYHKSHRPTFVAPLLPQRTTLASSIQNGIVPSKSSAKLQRLPSGQLAVGYELQRDDTLQGGSAFNHDDVSKNARGSYTRRLRDSPNFTSSNRPPVFPSVSAAVAASVTTSPYNTLTARVYEKLFPSANVVGHQSGQFESGTSQKPTHFGERNSRPKTASIYDPIRSGIYTSASKRTALVQTQRLSSQNQTHTLSSPTASELSKTQNGTHDSSSDQRRKKSHFMRRPGTSPLVTHPHVLGSRVSSSERSHQATPKYSNISALASVMNVAHPNGMKKTASSDEPDGGIEIGWLVRNDLSMSKQGEQMPRKQDAWDEAKQPNRVSVVPAYYSTIQQRGLAMHPGISVNRNVSSQLEEDPESP